MISRSYDVRGRRSNDGYSRKISPRACFSHRSTFYFLGPNLPENLTLAIRRQVYLHSQFAITRGSPARSSHLGPEFPHLNAKNTVLSLPKSLTFDGIAGQISFLNRSITRLPNPLTFPAASGSSRPLFHAIDASRPTCAPVKSHLSAVNAQKKGKIRPHTRNISPSFHVFSRGGSPKQLTAPKRPQKTTLASLLKALTLVPAIPGKDFRALSCASRL
ncbi:hypothetical protein OKW43_001220 [Paraburkholderia sp. WC7.3g]